MQWVTPNIGDNCVPVKQAMREAFIPDLFHDLREGTPGRGFTRLPMKQVDLELPDLTNTEPGGVQDGRSLSLPMIGEEGGV